MIELRMLGELDARAADGRQLRDVLAQPKRFALLAYLAVAQGGVRRRDTLLGLFWPDLDDSHARDALKQSISHLRRALGNGGGPAIVGRGAEELSLDTNAVWCDVAAFTAAVKAGDPKQALDLYRGDLLQGFFSNGSPAFDDWLGRERARLRGLACEAAQQLSGQAEARGDTAAAVSFAERAFALSDFDERVVRQLVHILDLAGDRAGAIRAYDAFARRLAAEYDVEPSAETRDLVARVRARQTTNGIDPAPDARDLHRSRGDGVTAAAAGLIDGDAGRVLRLAPPERWWSRRLSAMAAGALIIGTAGAWVASRTSPKEPADRRRVAVAPFDNLTRDTALAAVGRIAADWLTQGVAQMSSLEAVASGAAAAAATEARRNGGDVVQAVAKATRSTDVVTGTVTKFGDSIRVSATIIDARTSRVIRTIGPITGEASDPLVAINAIRERLLGSFAGGDLDRRIVFGSQPPKYAAIREFRAAMERLTRYRDVAGAARLFDHAIQLDSTYAGAYAGLAATRAETGDWDAVQHVLDRAEPLRARLSVAEQLHLDFFRARLRGDNAEVLRICQRLLVEDDSTAVGLLRIGLAANRLLRPRDAVPALRAADETLIEAGSQGGIVPLADAYHQAGDYAAELATLVRGRKTFPSNTEYAPRQLTAYAGLGRTREAERLADTLLAGVSPSATGGFPDVLAGASEFRAHGNATEGDRLTRLTIAWFESRRWVPTPARELVLARAFYDIASLDSAELHFQRAAADSTSVGAMGYIALVAARKGGTGRARTIMDSLVANPPKWDFGQTTYWHAAIVAQSGDRAQAVELLRRASQQGRGMADWHADGALTGMREYPPFMALVTPQK